MNDSFTRTYIRVRVKVTFVKKILGTFFLLHFG